MEMQDHTTGEIFEAETCQACNGNGWTGKTQEELFDYFRIRRKPCQHCEGRGWHRGRTIAGGSPDTTLTTTATAVLDAVGMINSP